MLKKPLCNYFNKRCISGGETWGICEKGDGVQVLQRCISGGETLGIYEKGDGLQVLRLCISGSLEAFTAM